MKLAEKYKSSSLKVGKYKVGLPGSDSYNAKTPKPVKITGETLLFIGGSIALLAGPFGLPVWLVAVGGVSTLAGRFLAKCFS